MLQVASAHCLRLLAAHAGHAAAGEEPADDRASRENGGGEGGAVGVAAALPACGPAANGRRVGEERDDPRVTGDAGGCREGGAGLGRDLVGRFLLGLVRGCQQGAPAVVHAHAAELGQGQGRGRGPLGGGRGLGVEPGNRAAGQLPAANSLGGGCRGERWSQRGPQRQGRGRETHGVLGFDPGLMHGVLSVVKALVRGLCVELLLPPCQAVRGSGRGQEAGLPWAAALQLAATVEECMLDAALPDSSVLTSLARALSTEQSTMFLV